MPPSGYSQKQTTCVRNFLFACAEDLLAEATQFRETIVDALDREISQIDAYKMSQVTAVQRATLDLTSLFYKGIRGCTPKGVDEFWTAVDQAAEQVGREIRAVHIPARPGGLERAHS